MWKLFPVCFLAACCLLVSCAVNDQQQAASDENQPAQGRVVRQLELPLGSSAQTISGQPSRSTFQKQGIQGWLDETAAWHISGEVHHGRLRCATYETGLQLGRGNPGCSNVEWLTDVEYVTRMRHCNNVTRLHVGEGRFSGIASRLEEVSCVRVAVRCEGTC
jgi:hypothetical protein